MTDRTDQLRDIFERVTGETTFTERQTEPRGRFRSPSETDAALRDIVRQMRTEYGFRTSLDDDALVRIVRGYHDGLSDRELAEALGVSPDTVTRARVNLHLFRERDTDAPFALAELERLLDDGASTSEAAEALGVSADTVRRYRAVVVAKRTASQTSHRYQTEFAEILEEGDVTVSSTDDAGSERASG